MESFRTWESLRRGDRVRRGLQFLVLADETFRKKVHDLMVEDRVTSGTCSEALHAAMTEHTIIWSECRLEVISSNMRRVQSSSHQQEKPNPAGKPSPKSRVQKLQQKIAALEVERNQKGTDRRRSRSRSLRRNRRGQAGRGKQD